MKTVVILEESESDFVKDLIRLKEFRFIFLHCDNHGNYSKIYEDFIRKSGNIIFYFDIYVDLETTYTRFKNMCFNLGIVSDEIWFFNMSEKLQYYAQDFAKKANFRGLVLDKKTTILFKDKYKMKQFLKQNLIPTVFFTGIEFLENKNFGFNKYLLKPRNNDSCRGIKYIDKNTNLKEYLLFKDYYIEEKIDYKMFNEYAADVVVNKNEIIHCFISQYPAPLLASFSGEINGGVTLRHVDLQLSYKIKKIIQRIINLLNINKGFVHLEFFYSSTKDEILISEFGYRLGGGRMIKNHEESFGISYAKIFTSLIEDERYNEVTYSDDKYVGELYLPVFNEGKIIKCIDEKVLYNLGAKEIVLNYKEGDYIKVNKTSFFSFGRVSLEGNSQEDVFDKMLNILDNYYLEVM